MDNPTTVAQTPGSHALTLTHAGITYEGTVEDDGSFTMQPENVARVHDHHHGAVHAPGLHGHRARRPGLAGLLLPRGLAGLKQEGANFFP